ncbi:MAG: hypothetical protein IKV61_02445 [Clostridia bacterium]|nr:hypothetical protein [Clostridia bacterium]
MKKNKLYAIILLLLTVIILICISACKEVSLQSLTINGDTFKRVYDLNEEINYSNIEVVALYTDGSKTTFKLNDESGATYTKVDTSTIGEKQLKIKYYNKEISVSVLVKASKALSFSLPQAYLNYLENSKQKEENLIGENEFFVKGEPYLVGNVNKFKFAPLLITDTGEIQNPKTTFKLYEKLGDSFSITEPANYVTASDNLYKFNDLALNKNFKLEISLDSSVYDVSLITLTGAEPTVSIEFKVVNAYNVYDTLGLSVMDNLNVKNWAKLKETTLFCDEKKLSEYSDVTLIVLQNDVAIDANLLPSNYFWQEYMTGYNTALTSAKNADSITNNSIGFASRLKGSLRNGINGDTYNHCGNFGEGERLNIYDENNDGVMENYNETWGCENVQKGIFNTNKCSVSGNYMTISVKDSAERSFVQVLGQNYDINNTNSVANPYSSWSIFKFYKDHFIKGNASGMLPVGEPVNIYVENLKMIGNMPKENKNGTLAGLIAINTFVDTLNVNNVITTQFYTHILADGNEDRAICTLNFNNSRMSDAFSNMIYLWRSKVNINNSILKNAGGPLFILCDSNRLSTEPATENNIPIINVDKKSILSSYASGTEAWYVMNNASLLFTNLKNNLNNAIKTLSNKSFVHLVNGAEQINMIAVVIPNAEDLSSSLNPPVNIYGKVIKDSEVYDLNDSITKVVKQIGSVCFNSNNQYAFMSSETTASPISALSSVNPALSTAPSNFLLSSNWLSITMSVSPKNNTPYFSVIVGDFK